MDKGYCQPNNSFTQLDNEKGNIRALFDDFKFIPALHIMLNDAPQFKKHKLSVKFLIQGKHYLLVTNIYHIKQYSLQKPYSYLETSPSPSFSAQKCNCQLKN